MQQHNDRQQQGRHGGRNRQLQQEPIRQGRESEFQRFSNFEGDEAFEPNYGYRGLPYGPRADWIAQQGYIGNDEALLQARNAQLGGWQYGAPQYGGPQYQGAYGSLPYIGTQGGYPGSGFQGAYLGYPGGSIGPTLGNPAAQPLGLVQSPGDLSLQSAYYGPQPGLLQPQALSHRGKGPKGYTRPDERIKEDISERLTDDPMIDASEVTIEAKQGVVTLSGAVDSRQLKHRIEDIVELCSGVKEIENKLSVRNPVGALAQSRGAASAGAQVSGTTTTGKPS
jgi:hypothetical protein